jgi:hypothetical protein
MANIQDTPSEIEIHLRHVPQTKNHIASIVRLLHQRENSRWKFNSQVEKVWLWESLLLAMHSNAWYEFRNQLYLPSAQIKAWRRKNSRMRALWMSWMFWLVYYYNYYDYISVFKTLHSSFYSEKHHWKKKMRMIIKFHT